MSRVLGSPESSKIRTRGSTSISPSRASSPNKLRTLISQGMINEGSPSYISAMEKIYEASWKFDRSKDDVILKSLDNRELSVDQFKQILSTGMHCKLTKDEFAAIRPLLDNHGNIDGSEFILLFYRLRFEHRGKFVAERIIADRKVFEHRKRQEHQSSVTTIKRKPVTLTEDFTPEHLQAAEEKMREAAVKYDSSMPGASPLDGFDVESMDAAEFRDHIKSVFHVKLSAEELSAYILTFYNETKDHRVNCSNFLLNFFRNGFLEKSRRLKALWKQKADAEAQKEKIRKDHAKKMEKKNAMQVNFNFTEEEKKNAIEKLRTAAKLYDKTTPGAMSMKAFEVKEMPPHVFKEQLKRIFNLHVNPAEMGALMSYFDVNGDGVITCEEFTNVFLKMGFEEREKELKELRQQQQERLRQELEQQMEAQREKDNRNALKVSYVYTDEEWESAMFKLKETAWRYDRTMPGAASLDAFEAQTMAAHELKDQLKRVFFMKLTPQELGAIMHYFDPDQTGSLNCAAFLKKFLRLGYEERSAKKTQYIALQKETLARKERKEKEKLATLEKKQNSVLSNMNSVQFTEEDFQTAFQKLTEAAMKYNKDSPGAASLQAFESISMPAHVFKEQCKIAFNMKLTLSELFALVNYFEKDGSGEIDCGKFICNFLQIGYIERNNLIKKFHKIQRQKKEEEKKALLMKDEESHGLNQNMNIVNYTYNEAEFSSMLRKFIHIAMTYNSSRTNYNNSSSINDLHLFQRHYLSAIEFRNALKSVFGAKVTSKELGAMVSFFDIYQKKLVHLQTFLNTLIQTNFKHRLFVDAYINGRTKGRKEEDWIEDTIDELKVDYQVRIAKSSSDKPWRSATDIGNFVAGRVFKRREHTSPADPVSKYILRVQIARRTGRLDLSSKTIWISNQDKSENKEVVSGEEENAVRDIADEPLIANSSESITSHSFTAQSNVSISLDAYLHSSYNSSLEHRKEKDNEPVEHDNELKELPIDHIYVDFRLHSLPPDIFKLSDLTELWLNNHKLTSLPKKISDLYHLEVLSVCNNQLASLPPELCNCTNLRFIYLRGNNLSTLPNILGKLAILEELDISNNSFSDFPEVLTTLSHLHYLNIGYNALTSFPATMRQMKCLYVLNLEGLKLSRAPPVLNKLPYTEVIGYDMAVTEKSAKNFLITPAEEFELMGLLRNRAALHAAENNRKKRSGLRK